MSQEFTLSGFQHPMAVSSSRNLLRLLWENRGVDPQYRRRIAEVMTMSLLTSPLRWYDWAFAFEQWHYPLQHVVSVSA